MQDYFGYIFGIINDVLGQHASLLEGMGMALFRSLALILVSWFGIQSALSSAGGSGGFQWAKFTALLQELLICYTMLAFYTVPIPGFGVSFTHLILDQVQSLVNMLNLTTTQEIMESLNGLDSNLPFPSPFEILQIIRYMVLQLVIVAAQAATLFVIMYGYVATAVIILLGPLFIPFKIVPQMEWMFWGWVRSFIQYAFYQLVASAYTFIFGQLLLQILAAKSTPLSGSDLGYAFVPLLLLLVTFILGILKIPSLVFSIFSGRAGDYILPRWR